MLELTQSYTLMCKKYKKQYLKEINNIARSRPVANKDIDQVFMLPEYMLLQGVLLKQIVQDKNLVFIGDGDHISIVLALIANPKSITVLDIDTRILESIDKWGKLLNYRIQTIHYDVFKPLPKTLLEKYDIYYTNPPYGSKNKGKSMIDFMKRGIEAINSFGMGITVMPYQHHKPWTIENAINIEMFVLKQGFSIEEKLDGLHLYDLEKEPDLTSSNLITKRVKYIKPSWQGKKFLKVKGFY